MIIKHLDLFSGIGGFTLGFQRAGGFNTVAFVEIDKGCQEVLKKNFPSVPIYSDICRFEGKKFQSTAGISEIDVITGGFPCQDLSIAGKQGGINEARSGLWWEMRRVISELRPKFAVMENVPNFLAGERGAWFGEFLASLAEIGYDAEWKCISAGAVGKPHLRERVWIVAYPSGIMLENIQFFTGIMPKNHYRKRSKQTFRNFDRLRNSLELLPEHLRVYDGISIGLDEIKGRIKMLGNAIVTDIAYYLGNRIKNFL